MTLEESSTRCKERKGRYLIYAAAITAGAFLLLEVQPMAGRHILPRLGGSSSVWSTCLVFFQTFLFAGYLYAHLVSTRLSTRRQVLVHGALIFCSLAFLPIAPGRVWGTAAGNHPSIEVLLFLAATLGLPYFLLSASSPLLQAWSSLDEGNRPYRLYAFSNFGSLAGLVAYPFLIEPVFTLEGQGMGWSAAYVVYALLSGMIMTLLFRSEGERGEASRPAGLTAERQDFRPMAAVFSLALCGSLLMAATTHTLCADLAVVPLLWVLPLALYLFTFILTFGWERCYSRVLFLPLMALATVAVVVSFYLGLRIDPLLRIAILSVFLLSACMVCHGEIVKFRPPPVKLTLFYLVISAGGAAGTALVTFVAPLVFSGYWELHAGVVLCWALAGSVLYFEEKKRGTLSAPRWGAVLAAFLLLVIALRFHTLRELGGAVRAERNFYGSLRVVETGLDTRSSRRLEFLSGGVLHGVQFADPQKTRVATAYYGDRSGLGFALRGEREKKMTAGGTGTLKIGAVGLGVGVIAAHGVAGDTMKFYELNPAVVDVAHVNFSFLEDSAADVEVVTGDARLLLEKEKSEGKRGDYDLLVVDAFTGGSIPVHLLTKECLELYLYHLADGGKIAFNISNHFLDLRPLTVGLAEYAGMELLHIDTFGDEITATRASTWALFTRDGVFSQEERRAAALSRPASSKSSVLWADDYSNIFTLFN